MAAPRDVRPPSVRAWVGSREPLRDAPVARAEPTLLALVRGTPALELEHRVLSPDGHAKLYDGADPTELAVA